MAAYAWCTTCTERWEKCLDPVLHKDAKRYRADFRLAGRRKRLLHASLDDANDFEMATLTDHKRGVLFPNLIGAKRSFGEACDYYRRVYMVPNKQHGDDIFIKRIEKFFGRNTSLGSIDPDRCKEFFAELSANLQPASVVRRWTLLISIFRENSRWCQINPAKGIIPKLYRKKADRPKQLYFTDEEYNKLLSVATRPEDVDVLVVFRHTGFRTGDGKAFSVEHCDFTTNTIHVPEQKNQEAGTIPMLPIVRDRVQDIMWRRSITSGRLLIMTNIVRRFRKLVKAAGLWQPYPYNKTLYSLRHSWGTYIQKNGKDLALTQKLMRHKSVRMTMRYVHAAEEALRNAAAAGSAGHFLDTKNPTFDEISEKE